METITKYRATDGTEWPTQSACAERDALDATVKALEMRLGPHPESRHQRRRTSVIDDIVKEEVVAICRRAYPEESVFKHAARDIHPMSYAGRLLSEIGGPLNRIWWRFCCMSGGWEYEQPFFALNPSEFMEREDKA